METGITPITVRKEQPNFVQTPYVQDIVQRALIYLNAGFPVRLSGPAGTGKTALALFMAAQLGRPVVLVHGDEELGSSDLVGGEHGYRRKKVVDNFVQSVLKTEEDVSLRWVDDRVTVACKYGFTLLYDEFTRSRPEANNVLLSVLEEKVLDLPTARGEGSYLRVHPDFAAIFTSNPQEYAGVHKAQDALLDRMITIQLGHYDRETEAAITQAKTGISRPDAEAIVDLVRRIRGAQDNGSSLSVRACIMIGKVLKQCGARPLGTDSRFLRTCLDILDSQPAGGENGDHQAELKRRVLELTHA